VIKCKKKDKNENNYEFAVLRIKRFKRTPKVIHVKNKLIKKIFISRRLHIKQNS